MYFLNEELFVNKGTNRICYKDPTDSSKCLKIDIRENKETKRELKYYKRLEKNNISFKMLSKYYGTVETNYGKAEVFELIRDYDGKISQEVDKYLNDSNKKIEELEKILKNIPLLKKYIYENRIYVKDLNTVNIMYQKSKDSNERLVIIDGLAHSNYNPFLYRFDLFILKKINESWNNFIKSIVKKPVVQKNPQYLKYLK
ncbi:YrbL family protein [Arcobacter sp.]|uniref:YrbL family protein n=1 Tax=Arcobacter sp. TaxID=1872629 RepID=UPI003C73C1E8